MVSVLSHSTIIPSKQTPNPKLYSLCEQIKLRLMVLNCAGRLSWINGGRRWEIHCKSKGALFLEAKCEELTNLNQLGDFVPTNLVSQLIPNINYNLPLEDIPLLAVQLTRFPCGGFTLGVALCRAATDGTATMRFMNVWAKLARGENLDPNEFPCHDRTTLNSHKLTHLPSLNCQHREFNAPPIWVGSDLNGNREVSVAIVKLTREQVLKLKKKASSRVSFQPTSKDVHRTKPYSTFEVIAGHLWKCVTKARHIGNDDQPTRLSTLVNCRNRLHPPLPNGYVGNAAFPTVTPTRSFNDLICKPLGDAVEDVKKAIERVNGEYVTSALNYIDREKDMDLLRYNFHYPAKSVINEGQYMGNPNLFVVSWMNFSYKDANFGLGEPVYFGPGYIDSEGKVFIMNNNNGDGIVVAISLEASFMDSFKKIFYDDIREVLCNSKL
ncbi:shikimate O-hydroxycinnamoyltransferase [Trifolium repens]|nr:shikimate O-hydroxycinnamoyltransferase [Trifolium repens]